MGENTNTSTETTAKKKGFFKGVKSEFKKISWPARDTVIKQTAAVVIISVILGVIISLLDLAIQYGVDKILTLG